MTPKETLLAELVATPGLEPGTSGSLTCFHYTMQREAGAGRNHGHGLSVMALRPSL